MKIKDDIQAKYNKGEINFKEMNKLYKKYENVLDVEKEDYDELAKYFDDNIKMSDIVQSIYNSMFIKVSNPISPSYTEKSYKDYTIEDPTLRPVYDPKYKSVTITRRKLP